MKITAVIVTYNRKKLLMECLDAINHQTMKLDEIVLIDNNSTDNTYEELINKKYLDNKKIIYKKLEKNIGGAGGFYEGIKLANNNKADWVWIMDDDTIPKKDCLENLVNSLDKINGKTSYLASMIYGEHEELMNVPSVNEDLSENGYSDWHQYLNQGIVKIKRATFVSLLINSKAINKIGYPVKDYFIWGDDSEYTLRLNRYYGPSYLISNSVAIHKRAVSKALSIFNEDNVNRIKMYFYMYRNTLINTHEYESKKRSYKIAIKNYLLCFKLLFNKNCPHKKLKIKTIFKATNSFLFKKYDYKAFRNRLDTEVVYEKV